jgi:hypothetical protein
MFVTCQQQTLIILSLELNKLKEMGLNYFHLNTFENIVKKSFHKNMDHITQIIFGCKWNKVYIKFILSKLNASRLKFTTKSIIKF